MQVVGHFGLTVSLPKTKGLAIREALSKIDVSSVETEGGVIEIVKSFTCHGLSLSCDGVYQLIEM